MFARGASLMGKSSAPSSPTTATTPESSASGVGGSAAAAGVGSAAVAAPAKSGGGGNAIVDQIMRSAPASFKEIASLLEGIVEASKEFADGMEFKPGNLSIAIATYAVKLYPPPEDALAACKEDVARRGAPVPMPAAVADKCRLADAAYAGKVEEVPKAIASSFDVSRDLFFQTYDRADSLPAHGFFRVEKDKQIVLSIRGTEKNVRKGLGSMISNLTGLLKPFCGGRAHQGMALNARSFFKRSYSDKFFAGLRKSALVDTAAEATVPPAYATGDSVNPWDVGLPAIVRFLLAAFPDHTFTITGHSLGAGVAPLVLAKLRDTFNKFLRWTHDGSPKAEPAEAGAPGIPAGYLEESLTDVAHCPLPIRAVVFATPSCMCSNLAAVVIKSQTELNAAFGGEAAYAKEVGTLLSAAHQGDSAVATAAMSEPLISTVILGDDIVPRISVDSVKDFVLDLMSDEKAEENMEYLTNYVKEAAARVARMAAEKAQAAAAAAKALSSKYVGSFSKSLSKKSVEDPMATEGKKEGDPSAADSKEGEAKEGEAAPKAEEAKEAADASAEATPAAPPKEEDPKKVEIRKAREEAALKKKNERIADITANRPSTLAQAWESAADMAIFEQFVTDFRAKHCTDVQRYVNPGIIYHFARAQPPKSDKEAEAAQSTTVSKTGGVTVVVVTAAAPRVDPYTFHLKTMSGSLFEHIRVSLRVAGDHVMSEIVSTIEKLFCDTEKTDIPNIFGADKNPSATAAAAAATIIAAPKPVFKKMGGCCTIS